MDLHSHHAPRLKYNENSVVSWAINKVDFFWANIFATCGILSYVAAMIYYLIAVIDKSGPSELQPHEMLEKITNITIWLNLGLSLVFLWITIAIQKSGLVEKSKSHLFIQKVFASDQSEEGSLKHRSDSIINRLNIWVAMLWSYGVIHYTLMTLIKSIGTLDLERIEIMTNTIGAVIITNLYFSLAIGLSKYDIETIKTKLTIVLISTLLTFVLFTFILYSENMIVHVSGIISTPEEFTLFMKAFGAIWTMIFLALFIARLDNSLIGIPSSIMSIGYGYAIIQVMHPFMKDHALLTLATLVFLVLFKVYFFVMYIYAFKTGRLYNFVGSSYHFSFLIEEQRLINLRNWIKNRIQSYRLQLNSVVIVTILYALLGVIFFRSNAHFHICLFTCWISLIGFLTFFFQKDNNTDYNYSSHIHGMQSKLIELLAPSGEKKYEKVKFRVSYFKRQFSLIWLALFLYYVYQIIKVKYNFEIQTYKLEALAHLFDLILNSLVIVFTYCTFLSLLILPTSKGIINADSEEWERKIKRSLRVYQTSIWFSYILGSLVLTLIILTSYFADKNETIKKTFLIADCISGVACGILFCLLLGKLFSRLIEIRGILFFPLFLFAGVQPLYLSDYSFSVSLFKAAIVCALIGKITLFLIVSFVTQTGRLERYFLLAAKIRTIAFSYYQNPLKINVHLHHNHYDIIIQNRGRKLLELNSHITEYPDAIQLVNNIQEEKQLINDSHRKENYEKFKKKLNNGQYILVVPIIINSKQLPFQSRPIETEGECNFILDTLKDYLYNAPIVAR